ncbi:MAG: 2-oxoglutarate dehydrogenase E1 component [Phycisphaeraceae bacterium]|nr:MAG: 2-oxoglutarate dehydrogenase E1 component [Phycisphaeraceae bacterium]
MSSSVKVVSPSVNGWNAEYIEEQYHRWKQDRSSVSTDMANFFLGFELAGARPGGVDAQPLRAAQASPSQLGVASLIRSFREMGHMAANVDPLGREREGPAELTPPAHGLSDEDLEQAFEVGDLGSAGEGGSGRTMTLREILTLLDETYCESVGVEFMHIQNASERSWIAERMEGSRSRPTMSRSQRVHLLYQLHRAELFETFLHKRYVGQKRFSLEGGESLIPLLDRVVEGAADLGVEEIVFGMPHRGRLNVLNNTLGKTYEQIFTEFEASWDEDFVEGGGDVKYHLGYSGDRTMPNGRSIRLVLSSNPSHLESVNGVVEGRCRAKQRLKADMERRRVIPLLIHGDAAFIAQGVVMEALNFSQLEGYTTGGTIHVVVNNQIGFTTGPEDARSSRYCTDIAKMIESPVFHVNGEDPEAVIHVAQIALEYRQTFRKDVVIDMWCYRKWGHNEGDDPSFTQPLMAALIKRKPGVLKTYAERLLAEKVITESDVEEIRKSLDEQMEKAQSSVSRNPHDPTIDPGSWRWQGFGRRYNHDPADTTVSLAMLREVSMSQSKYPEDFKLHRNLERLLNQRGSIVDEDAPIDWGTAETLAYGTLLLEGTSVRVSGQDSRRGTFSHRHAVVRDNRSGEPYVPLNNMREMGEPGAPGMEPGTLGSDGRPRQARLCIYDSPLSEMGILGFEYGYALADPNMLVIWEAQFGDFNNGAQIIIDQYIASAELKWQRWNGLTLLLPHAYEGQGPEHSSARMERFLQLCADDNMQVVYPTTPAQGFHMFRRQVRRPFRKPLIVMSPKSLLRLSEATSRVADLTEGRFREILDDPRYSEDSADQHIEKGDLSKVRRVVLCSGKVYYDLARRREEAGRDDIAIVRVEQLYPMHEEMLRQVLSRYPDKAELVWTQEEPKNMGAYTHMSMAVAPKLGLPELPYIGRPASSTPATGSKKQHDREQEKILAEAVGVAQEARESEAKAAAN